MWCASGLHEVARLSLMFAIVVILPLLGQALPPRPPALWGWVGMTFLKVVDLAVLPCLDTEVSAASPDSQKMTPQWDGAPNHES